jgi:protoporphyrinogen oxidase
MEASWCWSTQSNLRQRTILNYPMASRRSCQSHPLTIVGIVASFLWSSLKQAVIDEPIVNMERAYTAQFGASLYRMFFQRYSEKVWGRPCTELSADWVTQRSRGLSIWGLAREALLGSRKDVVSLIVSSCIRAMDTAVFPTAWLKGYCGRQ